MNNLKTYILRQVATQQLAQDEAKQLLLELAQQQLPPMPAVAAERIAVIGMAGRFPQAEDAEAFWQQLRDGLNCIVDYPLGRRKDIEPIMRNPYYLEYLTGNALVLKDLDDVFAPAGYMQDVDKFDAAFFGIPPNEAIHMDPNQRLTLEVAWEAMENAGYGGEALFGTDTGVYIGREGTNVAFYRFNSKKDPMQLTGSWESIIASRISYLFNLRGPSMLVDTACSSSLVSVHMACKAILSGECSLALAGGVNLVHGELKSKYQGGMNMSSVESEDNVIRTFDAQANGTVWGEGVAMVLLKPLSQALADGDPIHAVIDGSAINNDGASNALTAPNAETQEAVIVKAWQNAGIHPESLSYIEAHGTGTVLGDPIEFKALSKAFRRYTDKAQFCAIGSLKTNMGHLVASSGIASLFKVIKSMQHRQIAPTINFQQPNPYINFAGSPLYVADRLQDWTIPEGAVRRAGISSFGFNHTNCHMVVAEAPARPVLPATQSLYCLTISAKKLSILRDYLNRYLLFVADNNWNLADLCYTAAVGRGHYNYRLCVIARTEAELKQRLTQALQVLDGSVAAGISFGGHQMVSEKKTQRQAGDLTERERKQLSEQAASCLQLYLSQPQPELLSQLASFYCQGAEVDWRQCYRQERRQRLAQPGYPLERVRYWAETKVSQVAGFSAQLHPLLGQLVHHQRTEQAEEWLFSALFSNEEQWVLADHKINGTGVVPGTTYLEMARVAAKEALGLRALTLADMFFLQPMVVHAQQQRVLHLRLSRDINSTNCLFQISSRGPEDDSHWQQHVEGVIRPLTDSQAQDQGYQRVQQQASMVIAEYMAEADTGVFQFGPHWDTVRSVWHAGAETLARLALPEPLVAELADYQIHPSMLDNAMNLVSQTTGHTYLPFMYKSFQLYQPFCSPMYSRVLANGPMTGEEETHSYDVVMTDLSGRLIARAEGYVTKKVHSFAFQDTAARPEFVGMRWTGVERPAARSDLQPATVLLISAEQLSEPHGQQLASLWQASGIDVRHAVLTSATTDVQSGRFAADANGIATLLDSALAQGIDTLVWACQLHVAPTAGWKQPEVHALQQQLSLDALFLLAKALLERKYRLSGGLQLLSCGAYTPQPDIAGTDAVSNPLAAASALFALSFAMEAAAIPCKVLDVSAAALAALTSAALDWYDLCQQLPAGQIFVLDQHSLYQQELAAIQLPAQAAAAYAEDGVYLITGGLGGLGLAAAAELASHGRLHVVLAGRAELAPPAAWAALAESGQTPAERQHGEKYALLSQLQTQLASLSYVRLDVTDAKATEALVQSLLTGFGRINGVFHAAGVAGDGFVLRKSADTFRQVLAAKLQGTVNILAAMQHQSTDFICLYSSITGLLGGEGQSDYAAANAFLDAIVAPARRAGLPVHALNWPSWSETGMAVDYQLDTGMTPFQALTNQQAFARLHQVQSCLDMPAAVAYLVPADINPAVLNQLSPQLPCRLAAELRQQLLQAAQQDPQRQTELTGRAVQLQILGKSMDEMTATEIELAGIYAAVLGISELDLFANFQDMGGNSIIATHLLKVIEQQYPGLVDISDIFS